MLQKCQWFVTDEKWMCSFSKVLEVELLIINFWVLLHLQGPDKKYFKRGDLAAKQEEEYWKKHKRWKPEEEV